MSRNPLVLSCNLNWKSRPNLNSPLVPSGFGYVPIRKGPYIEGQNHSIRLIARYEKMTPNGPISCSRVRYRLLLNEFQQSQGISLDENTGILSLNIPDIDAYLDGIAFVPQRNYNSLDYFDIARRPNPRRIFLDIEAYPASSPNERVARTFFLDIAVNWDSRTRAFIIGPRKIDTQFAIDAKAASNEQYYSFLKSKKYI